MNFFLLFLSAWLFSCNTLASSGRLSNIHVYTNTTPQKLKPAASLLKPEPAVYLPKLKTASFEDSPAAFSALFPANFSALFPNIHLEAHPISSAFEYQTAGIYWLPDYVSKNGGYGYGGRTNDNPPSGNNNSCADYGFEACQAPKTLRPGAKPVHPVLGLDCYKKSDCICPTGTGGYNYSSANCSGNKQPSGDTCNGLYKECTCKDGFTYNSTNCKGEYQLAGDSCDDNYQRCDPKPCSDGGYSDRTIDGKICSAVIYGGRTCQACRDKTCEEKCSGFQTGVTCAKGQNTETCSSECGNYVKCTGEACPTGIGSCEYGCQTYSTQNNCSDVCLECKKCAPTCTNETDCPYGTETVDNGCRGTCTKCKTCIPNCKNETQCSYGTESVSNGCGGTCTKCKTPSCDNGTVNYNDYMCGNGLTCLLKRPQDQICTLLPSCKELGFAYRLTQCNNQKRLVCPFDSNRAFCYEPEAINCTSGYVPEQPICDLDYRLATDSQQCYKCIATNCVKQYTSLSDALTSYNSRLSIQGLVSFCQTGCICKSVYAEARCRSDTSSLRKAIKQHNLECQHKIEGTLLPCPTTGMCAPGGSNSGTCYSCIK